MRSNRRKRTVVHLGRNNHRHQYMLGANQLETSFAGKDLGILVDTKWNEPATCLCRKGREWYLELH